MTSSKSSRRKGLLNRKLSVAELEEGDLLELTPKPPVLIKTDDSFASTYKSLDELGKGKFGVVYKVSRKSDGEILAAKFVRKSAASKKEVTREIQMMNHLHHKRLIQLYDAFETKQDMIVVMEMVTGGELFEKVVEEDNLTEKQVIRYTKQVLYGVQHMHRKSMVHLDLKPENILCVGGGKPGYEEIKLIDFGMTRILKKGEEETAMCGTPEFVAPEVITFNPITVQADMWSIGVITYVLLSGLSPFMGDDDNETLSNVTSGEYDFDDGEEIFEHLSEEVKLFIQNLLVLKPEDRLTVDECLEHSWLRNEGSEKKINTANLKKFIARRRWQRTMNTIKAVSRLAGGLSLFASKKKNGAHGAGKGDFLSRVKAQQAAEEAEARKKQDENALQTKDEEEQKKKVLEKQNRERKELEETERKQKEEVQKRQEEKERKEREAKRQQEEKDQREREEVQKRQEENERKEQEQTQQQTKAKNQPIKKLSKEERKQLREQERKRRQEVRRQSESNISINQENIINNADSNNNIMNLHKIQEQDGPQKQKRIIKVKPAKQIQIKGLLSAPQTECLVPGASPKISRQEQELIEDC